MNKVKKNRIRGKKIYETKAVPKLFIKKEVEVYWTKFLFKYIYIFDDSSINTLPTAFFVYWRTTKYGR